ncbi:RNA-guided endonuclease InsQ/TnpB family protein [Rhizobium mongolense]|uniref:Transposase n=1 Tax=Rhizobium mongolense TaxID=57676 RepID=A0A7W6WC54_9HYPH|nr:zinc ribbon domain-containing protein [Rhizobium mongolense]MBB4272947.1 transposase [Rhizobium mongolense]
MSLAANGWHIAFACEIDHAVAANDLPAVGIDRGVANTLTLSTGEHWWMPAGLAEIERRKRRAQRVLARRKRGSRRHAKAPAAALQPCRPALPASGRIGGTRPILISPVASQRSLEDLATRNMTRSARKTVDAPGTLNRAILAQGWHGFETVLAYKLEERGGYRCKVDPRHTSQSCSACGAVDRESREGQASFRCCQCGLRAHADHNAAINILRRNTASMIVEEGQPLSVEVVFPARRSRTTRGREVSYPRSFSHYGYIITSWHLKKASVSARLSGQLSRERQSFMLLAMPRISVK